MIESKETIMVEHILDACGSLEPGYHEDLADQIFEKLGGGKHVLVAYHHGVLIETIRGWE